jgi:hypothetical protein
MDLEFAGVAVITEKNIGYVRPSVSSQSKGLPASH